MSTACWFFLCILFRTIPPMGWLVFKSCVLDTQLDLFFLLLLLWLWDLCIDAFLRQIPGENTFAKYKILSWESTADESRFPAGPLAEAQWWGRLGEMAVGLVGPVWSCSMPEPVNGTITTIPPRKDGKPCCRAADWTKETWWELWRTLP